MQVDYIIVGFGLAGMAFAKTLEDNGHSFVVMNDNSQVSSKVAAGVFNPVILKRFTPVWNAEEQLAEMFPFYNDISNRLGKNYIEYFDSYKVFKTIEDQNNWFKACDHPLLEKYLQPKLIKDHIPGIIYGQGFGHVKGTGRVFITQVLEDYKQHLKSKEQFLSASFDYDVLSVKEEDLYYQNIKAKKIVFAEGYGVTKNPFFKYLSLVGAKGEMLIIKAPDLQLRAQIKSSLFVMPMGDDLYWVGATFNWTDKTTEATKGGKEELLEKLKTIIDVPFTIEKQLAGIRPTVKDRRPLVGVHPEHQNIAVLNGLGTRGVMISPTVAKQLYNHLEKGENLPSEIDIKRFKC